MIIGFIGAGNMATAMLRGMIAGGVSPATFMAFDINPERQREMSELGIATADNALALAEASDITVLAVKPQFLPSVLAQLRQAQLRDVLSIVVGWTQAMLESALPNARGIAHAMPNTPAQVCEAVIAVNDNHTIDQERFSALSQALSACGRVFVIPESLFDAVTGVSGSGPAYAYIFIEALADAGVRQGLPRDMAYAMSAQMLVGAGRMLLRTGQHPGALKDAVCSPGGTTIEAVYALEKAGFRSAIMDAVKASASKAALVAERYREPNS